MSLPNPFEPRQSLEREVWHRRARIPLIVGLATLFGFGFQFMSIELPGFGREPRYWLLCVFAAIGFYFAADKISTANTDTTVILKKCLLRMLILYLSAFGGRILFTFFPPWDGTVGIILGFIGGLYTAKNLSKGNPFPTFTNIRGSGLSTSDEVDTALGSSSKTATNTSSSKEDSVTNSPLHPQGLSWAGKLLPERSAQHNFCTIGTPGSGKSLMHLELLRSVIPRIRPGSDRRVLILDIKAELLSQIASMNPQCPVILLNPFDQRSFAWNMAADFNDIDRIHDYARPFIVNQHGDTPFFADAARGLLAGIFYLLITRSPGTWTLSDVVHLSSNGAQLRKTFEADPTLWQLFGDHFSPEVTYQSVKQTLNNSMQPLRTVAALWQQVPRDRQISLRNWLTQDASILVLASKQEHAESLRTLNQAIFSVIAKGALSLSGAPLHDRLWFFVDELQEVGKLESMRELLSSGRSKGIRAVVGFQSMPGLYEMYGDNVADSIVGSFGNFSVLSLGCPKTAEWAVSRFGKHEDFVTLPSGVSLETLSKGREKITYGTQLMTRETVMNGQFLTMPPVNSGLVAGFHIITADRRLLFYNTVRHPLIPSNPSVDFVSASPSTLREWTSDDLARLTLADVAPPAQNAATATPPKPSTAAEDTLKALQRAKPWRQN